MPMDDAQNNIRVLFCHISLDTRSCIQIILLILNAFTSSFEAVNEQSPSTNIHLYISGVHNIRPAGLVRPPQSFAVVREWNFVLEF
jgi:hypothetical protein